MRPLAAITLIILGSCFAIMVSLAAVNIIVLVLGDEYPRLQHEFDASISSLAVFTSMTTISALSFYTLVKKHTARYFAQGAMWVGLMSIVWYYWP